MWMWMCCRNWLQAFFADQQLVAVFLPNRPYPQSPLHRLAQPMHEVHLGEHHQVYRVSGDAQQLHVVDLVD